MFKLPPVKFNVRMILVGALALGSVFIPQMSTYFGVLSASIQQSPQYNSTIPSVEVSPSWGCTHLLRKEVSNDIQK